ATFLLGTLQAQQGAIGLAIEAFRRAVRLNPRSVDARYNLALAMNLAEDHEAALKHYQRVLKLEPQHVDGTSNYAGTLAKLGRFQDAVDQYRKLIALRPNHAEAYYNLGVALTELDRFEEAIESAERALSINPAYAEAHFIRGVALAELRRVEAALSGYDRAIALKPDYADAHQNRYLLRLLQGDFAGGWPEMEWRRMRTSASATELDAPLWRGDGDGDIAGKTILVHWEQGFGDTIQFCRFVPLLRDLGANVLFMPQRTLLALKRSLGGDLHLVEDGATLPRVDYRCPLMSLPLAFKATPETIPRHIPYLCAEPHRIDAWRNIIGERGFKVGIAWHSAAMGAQPRKSAPLAQFLGIAKLAGVRLISLQKHEGAEELGKLAQGMKVETLGDTFDAGADAFLDTAAVMKNLDLVITIDTSIAHLAGALNVPVWVALKQVPDWRWLMDRSDSPWYPSARLFRQTVRDDWSGVFKRIETALAERLMGGESRERAT